MRLYLALAAVFITVFFLILLILRLARARLDPTTRRVRSLAEAHTPVQEEITIHDALKQTELPAGIEKLLINLGRLGRSNEKAVSRNREMLIQAGLHHEYGPVILMGLRICSLFLFAVCFYLFAYRHINQPMLAPVLLMLTLLIGFRFPDYLLRHRISRRRQQIGESLADALDLLVICMEAGLGLNAALLRVAQELGMRAPILSQELLLVTQEMRTGLSREKALRNLSTRNRVENLRILVGALVLADKLGTSLADTLRAQADSLRTRLRQSAEEQAAKAGIKMLFPLILFIFPALFIVILGPGIISILKTFAGMSGP